MYRHVLFTVLFLWSVQTLGKRPHKRFTKENICKISSTTIKAVNRCPKNESSLQGRLKEKTCELYPFCGTEPLIYHCIRNNTNFIEICAPRGQITGGICPLFDKGLGRVIEDYNTPCEKCPFRYYSNESIQFSECMNVTKSFEPCEKPSLGCQNKTTNYIILESTTTEEPCNNSIFGIRNKRSLDCENKTSSTTQETNATVGDEPSKNTQENFMTIVPILLVVLIAVALGIAVFLVRIRNRQTRSESDVVFTNDFQLISNKLE